MTKQDRAKGAFLGAIIGEALGVGPHWFYDLEEQYKHYGTWIDDYTNPMPGRYHDNLKKGDISQQGWLMVKMAEYLVNHQGYDDASFKRMVEEEIFPHLDGTPRGGYGGYTSQVMRDIYQGLVVEKKSWDDVASIADTTESLERNIATAIYYANDLKTLSEVATDNVFLTQKDNMTASLSVAYNVVLASLINGAPLDASIGSDLMKKVYKKELPFHAVTSDNLSAPNKGEKSVQKAGTFGSPDGLLSPSFMALAATDPGINIEPAWKVSLVYGMPCAIYHVLPASYYLAARFKDDFEQGVLHAINGGGQNQIRAMLTGALIGAQVGLSGIPQRFIDGLNEKDAFLSLAESLTKHL